MLALKSRISEWESPALLHLWEGRTQRTNMPGGEF